MFININKNDNSIKDEELNENQVDTKFSMFNKQKPDEETAKKKFNKPSNNDNNMVDYNNKFLKGNKKKGHEFFKVIKTLLCFAIAIAIVMYLFPKFLHYDDYHKKEYVKLVNEMVDKVIVYYTQDDMHCTSTTKDVYYFDVNKSDEIFGEKYHSPFINNPMEGYVEFDVTDNNYTVYVSFTDGLFGFDRIEYSKLKPSDVKLFTYLSLDRHTEMECDKSFVFPE